MDAEMPEHLRAAAVVALVGLKPEVHVGIHGVHALFLQLVCGNFIHQSDASTFLLHVDNHTLTLFLDHLHRLVQLLAAVASLTAENVSGGAR